MIVAVFNLIGYGTKVKIPATFTISEKKKSVKVKMNVFILKPQPGTSVIIGKETLPRLWVAYLENKIFTLYEEKCQSINLGGITPSNKNILDLVKKSSYGT